MVEMNDLIQTALDNDLDESNGIFTDIDSGTKFDDKHTAYLFEVLKQAHLKPKLKKGSYNKPDAIYVPDWKQQILLDQDNHNLEKLVVSKDEKHVSISDQLFDQDLSLIQKQIVTYNKTKTSKKDASNKKDDLAADDVAKRTKSEKKKKGIMALLTEALEEMDTIHAPWGSREFTRNLQKRFNPTLVQEGLDAKLPIKKNGETTHQDSADAKVSTKQGQIAFKIKADVQPDKDGQLKPVTQISRTGYDQNGLPTFTESLGGDHQVTQSVSYDENGAPDLTKPVVGDVSEIIPVSIPEEQVYLAFKQQDVSNKLESLMAKIGAESEITDLKSLNKLQDALSSNSDQAFHIVKQDVRDGNRNIGTYQLKSGSESVDQGTTTVLSSKRIAQLAFDLFKTNPHVVTAENLGNEIQIETDRIARSSLKSYIDHRIDVTPSQTAPSIQAILNKNQPVVEQVSENEPSR